ncbi:hypothetical protein PLUTE_a5003 [Pseudoalteromonas luteoviolacea DSM 6061]|nr:hypothetical protein [Pseudoalteromonas luteoviolacea DSM 6061]
MSVLDINEAHERIKNLQGFDFKYNPIQEERWGKVNFFMGAIR